MASLDLILPAYNPLPGWEENVITRFHSLQNALPGIEIKLVIVNDGSQKLDESNSVKILKNSIPELQWISYPENRGKGHALRSGVAHSMSNYIVYTDIDWPYTEESMTRLIHTLDEGADAVIGTRDAEYYKHLPSTRRSISRFLKKINSTLLRLKVDDTQAGLKGFRKNVKDIFLATTIDRYLFDLEFIYLLSHRKDIQLKGIPIALRPGITFTTMNRKILLHEAKNFLKIWLKS